MMMISFTREFSGTVKVKKEYADTSYIQGENTDFVYREE